MAQPALNLPQLGRCELDYLGPAEVTHVEAGRITVAFGEGRQQTARLALANPYEPVVGDVVVVIGATTADTEPSYYVIGLLHGQGAHRLAFDGDVELSSRDGKLRLRAAEGIEIQSDSVTMVTKRLRSIAEVAHRSYGRVQERVRDLLSVHAGSEQRLVDRDSVSKARSSTILTEEEMSINGKRIHLG